ncbi:MAG TPA: hypothetical protein VL966_13840 [Alphaproteobacteria bacterium]|nr:hypothetical protein [Alphaproteobacteria bacterium]
MASSMSLARLEQLVAAYGADPERWPEAERGPALALVERSAEARARVAEARRLDRALDAARVTVDELSLARVTAKIQRRLSEPRATGGGWLSFLAGAIGPTWSRGAALASVALLGILVGLSSDPSLMDNGAVDGIASLSDTSIMGAISPWSE